MNQKELKYRKLMLLRAKRIILSRESFWEYCKTESPEFYKESYWHLKLNCHVLQALYERKLTKKLFKKLVKDIAPDFYAKTIEWDKIKDNHVYTKLIQNLPPRHGKSRTLVNFCKWVFGKDHKNKVITTSYNDEMATDFSRYTRDGIQQQKTYPHEIDFNDIFPDTKIKFGNAGFHQWALEGSFFSYKGAGVGGSITGKGCSIAIVDDPVKDAETAYNEGALAKIWLWYTGTFLSRLEEGGIEVVNMTRWSKNDVCGKILSGKEADNWLVFKVEACYDDKHMLCDELLSYERYKSLETNVDGAIFRANYHQEPVDVKGRLYSDFKTYEELPCRANGKLVTERIMAYTDTADTGDDYLCSIAYHVYKDQAYIVDVLYSKKPMEVTEPLTAKQFVEHNVSIAQIESNNGGRGFARNVERIMWDEFKTRKTVVKWFHQSANKKSRILTNATYVSNNIYMPVDWRSRWTEFYNAVMSYQKEGKNIHDDAPDVLTGISEYLQGKKSWSGLCS